MSSLKKQLIRLGSTNPELQEHIRPVLDEIKKSRVDDSVYRDLMSISSGSLNSMLDLGGRYSDIDKDHEELLEFAKSSPRSFQDWRDAVEAFKRTRKASERTASTMTVDISGFKAVFKLARKYGLGDVRFEGVNQRANFTLDDKWGLSGFIMVDHGPADPYDGPWYDSPSNQTKAMNFVDDLARALPKTFRVNVFDYNEDETLVIEYNTK